MSADHCDDAEWMRRAVQKAARGTGSTYPNPSVGAVLVREGKLVAEAHSAATGGAHAEVRVLRRAGERARGATLFVTLEPCSHFGRTPPCVSAILDAGVARVVVGIVDPAPHVAGAGIRALRQAGIDVVVCDSDAARRVHAHYLWHIQHGRPWVTLKAATTLDGQVACRNGHSQWITSEEARRRAHRLRARHHAILIGRETLFLDRPALTVRHCRGVDPIPVILDSKLELVEVERATSFEFPAVRAGTVVFSAPDPARARRLELEARGVQVVEVPRTADGYLSLEAVLDELGRRSIRSLLVEGGGRVLGSFVRHPQLWQQFRMFIAPKFLGEGRRVLRGWVPERVDEGPGVELRRVRRFGDELELDLRPLPNENRRNAPEC